MNKYQIGIMAYGSLINDPGEELFPCIINKIPCKTPFRIEYARTSKSRSNGPTLIPYDLGIEQSAYILVLDKNISIEDAMSMLWRRETRTKGRSYNPSTTPGKNKVIIESIKNFNGFDLVLYTNIGSNIIGDITAEKLADLAIKSILDKAGAEKKDGVRYLLNAMDNKILTPLTNDYCLEILKRTKSTTLHEAIKNLDEKRIQNHFRKYLEVNSQQHLTINENVELELNFEKRIRMYNAHYGLLGGTSQIFLKDKNGDSDLKKKLFCTCPTCSDTDLDYDTKYKVYIQLLQFEYLELKNMVESSLPYSTKLLYWDSIFKGAKGVSANYDEFQFDYTLNPADSEEVKVENEFNYQNIIRDFFKDSKFNNRFLGHDFASRKNDFIDQNITALYPNELVDKSIIRIKNNEDSYRDTQSEVYFEQLVDGKKIDLSEQLFEYKDLFSYVVAKEDFEFLKFLETYKSANQTQTEKSIYVERSTLPIDFQRRNGTDFERMAFAYLNLVLPWDKLEWLGEVGGDGGRDIWGVTGQKTICYQCANYRSLKKTKVFEDIDKLVRISKIPNCFIVICGGTVSVRTREEIAKYARENGIFEVQVWSGSEFEELLRCKAPSVIKRFVEGVVFPD